MIDPTAVAIDTTSIPAELATKASTATHLEVTSFRRGTETSAQAISRASRPCIRVANRHLTFPPRAVRVAVFRPPTSETLDSSVCDELKCIELHRLVTSREFCIVLIFTVIFITHSQSNDSPHHRPAGRPDLHQHLGRPSGRCARPRPTLLLRRAVLARHSWSEHFAVKYLVTGGSQLASGSAAR